MKRRFLRARAARQVPRQPIARMHAVAADLDSRDDTSLFLTHRHASNRRGSLTPTSGRARSRPRAAARPGDENKTPRVRSRPRRAAPLKGENSSSFIIPHTSLRRHHHNHHHRHHHHHNLLLLERVDRDLDRRADEPEEPHVADERAGVDALLGVARRVAPCCMPLYDW